MTCEELLDLHPPRTPLTRLAWTAIVDVAERQDLGPSVRGHRYMVPILGGHFFAGDIDPTFAGVVLPGGADRQLIRNDGIKDLDALYEMKTADGAIVTIRNKVTVDESRKPERYAMSVISVSAPSGPYEWLNRRSFIGTLQSARPLRQAVIVRAWETDV